MLLVTSDKFAVFVVEAGTTTWAASFPAQVMAEDYLDSFENEAEYGFIVPIMQAVSFK